MQQHKILRNLCTLAGIACLWLVSAIPAFAVGGTCPTGANYLDLSNPSNGGGNGSITLSAMGITSCFYISAAGVDTNNGTSEATPWLHAPGMPSCANTCASTTPTSNEGFIFRGGDTWHKSSGSPAIGGIITWGQSGSNLSNPIYLGVDFTWFSGGSFARPVFSEDNPLSTTQVASCSFNDDGTTFFSLSGKSNVILDALEFTGDCAASTGSGTIRNNGSNNVIERLYTHGWTFASASTGDNRFTDGGTGPNRYLFDVIDGADSTFGANCTTTACVQTATNVFVTNGAAGESMVEAFDVEYSIIRHASNLEPSNPCIFHDNLIEFLFEPSIGTQHGNVLETFAPGNTCPNFFFYNNLVRNVNEGVGLWIQCGLNANSNNCSVVEFNNVFENDGHNQPDPNMLMESPSCIGPGNTNCGGTGVITLYYFNNTNDPTVRARTGVANANTPAWGTGSTANFQNNHLVGSPTTIAGFFALESPNVGTTIDNGNEKFQTAANATTQNYLLTNDYSPGNGGGTYTTIGGGANLTSTTCPTVAAISSAPSGISSACTSGTSKGVTEVSQWGGKAASWPAVTVNARPSSGAWDAGAYQFAVASISQTINGVVQMSGSAVMK